MKNLINQMYRDPSAGATFGIGLASGAASGIMDLAFARPRQKIQLEGQKKALEQQNAASLDLWNKTNYGAQMAHLKSAGLNPGLLYGMGGGAGGQTGSASAMTAPVATGKGMDIQSAAQLALLKAQTENIQADTEAKKTGAAYTAGAQTEATKAGAQKTTQETKNLGAAFDGIKLDNALKQLSVDYQGATLEERKQAVSQQLRMMDEQLVLLQNQRDISDDTKFVTMAQIRADYAVTMLEKEVMRQGIKLSQSQVKKIHQEIKNLEAEALAIPKNAETNRWNAETNQQGANTNQQRLDWDKTMNRIAEDMNLTVDVVKGVLQAVGIGAASRAMQAPRTVIEGYKPKY